ncbi:MAG: hypothetical protein QW815_00450 [Nitrososphaerota archaeon]
MEQLDQFERGLDVVEAEEEALRQLIMEEGIPVVRKTSQVTLTLFDGKSTVVVKPPTATIISTFYDKSYSKWMKGEGMTEAELYLLSQCLEGYTLYDPETGEILVDSKKIPKGKLVSTFIENIHPLIYRWLLRKLIILSGVDYTKILRRVDEIMKEKGLISEVPEEGK